MTFDITQAWKNAFNVQEKYKTMEVDEIASHATADRLPFGVCMLNLEKDINIANVIRTAHCMGAEVVYALGWRKVDNRGMVGCQNYTNYIKKRVDENDIDAVISFLREQVENGYTPIFAEWNEYSRSINSSEFDDVISNCKPLLIMGNEGLGIPLEVMSAFNNQNIFHIPQRGVIRSMNVAAASSILQFKIASLKGL